MTTSRRKLLVVTAFAVIVFVGMSLLCGDLSSGTTSAGTEDELDLGVTGWLEVGRGHDGWHVGHFHFWSMLLEMAVVAGSAAIISRGYCFVWQPAPVIKTRKFYPAAFLCGIAAFALSCAGHGLIDKYSSRSAHALSVAYTQHVKYVRDAESVQLLHIGNVLNGLGLIMTISGFTCLVVALARREPGWYLILTGLLIVDLMVLMMS